MRKTLLTLAVLGGAVALGAAAPASAATAQAVHGAPHLQTVQYYDPDWREHEYWRHRRQEEWRRRQAWREHEDWREREAWRERRAYGAPPAVMIAPPPVVYGRGW